MSTDRQRDADLDRLLRARLRRESAEAPDACPDAGMLAALVEGGAAADERAALEAHVASCGRCQDTLAVMGLDEPPSPVIAPAAGERRPWLWRGHLHWLIPVGAASVLVIYFASKPAIAPYFPPIRPAPATQTAELRPSEEVPGGSGFASPLDERPASPSRAVPAPAPAAPASEAGQPKLAASSAATGRSQRERKDVAAPAFVREDTSPPPKGERAALDVDASKRAAKPAADANAHTAPRPAATIAEVVAGVPPAQAVVTTVTAGAPVVTAAPPAPTEPPAGAAGLAQDATSPKGAARVTAADLPAGVAGQDVSAQRVLRTAAADLVVAIAPGGAIQWRVGPGGALWRSADEGRSWYPQKSGVKAALLAAAAPSISTCWAVGAGGTILLTDDGERWERRPFPEETDLVAVDARSAHEATVTTRDGRRFATADRGATWTLQRQLP